MGIDDKCLVPDISLEEWVGGVASYKQARNGMSLKAVFGSRIYFGTILEVHKEDLQEIWMAHRRCCNKQAL